MPESVTGATKPRHPAARPKTPTPIVCFPVNGDAMRRADKLKVEKRAPQRRKGALELPRVQFGPCRRSSRSAKLVDATNLILHSWPQTQWYSIEMARFASPRALASVGAEGAKRQTTLASSRPARPRHYGMKQGVLTAYRCTRTRPVVVRERVALQG